MRQYRREVAGRRTAATIARLLDGEGFTEHLANVIENYWLHCAGLTERQRARFEALNEAFSKIVSRMSEGDRLVIGKFIGLHKKMAFDSGLRVGLNAFAIRQDKKILGGGIGALPNDLPIATQHKPKSLELRIDETS